MAGAMAGERIRRVAWGTVQAATVLAGSAVLALALTASATAATDVAPVAAVSSGPAPAPLQKAGQAPSRRPSPVQYVTAVPGTSAGSVLVTWSPPAYNGSFLNRHRLAIPYGITDYDILGVPAKTWASCDDMSFACTVTGLTPGKSYAIRMVVWNARGRRSVATTPVTVVAPSTSRGAGAVSLATSG